MQEEKNYYFQRKVDQLEVENRQMKETLRTAEQILTESIPRLGELLERPIHRHADDSNFSFGKQVLEMVELEFRSLRKGHAVLSERANELMRQTEVFKTEL